MGHPTALNATEELRDIAKERGWPVARLKTPPSTSVLDLGRSAAAMGVFAGSVAASAGSDLALAAAGVRLNVVGEENIWAARPAVFLFNHQSQLDVFVLAALLRKDFTGVAKKSLEKDPFFGPIGYLADVAYIDRSNNAAAREGLEPAVEALRNGRSIAIAPEGTRSPTPRLLPFKKGPFHLAMQAGVPVVPIVMRTWSRANLEEKIAEVRQMYLDTLGDWPED